MKKLLSLVLSLALLTACTTAQPPTPPEGDRAEFDAFIARLDAARRDNAVWTDAEWEQLLAWTPDFPEQLDAFTEKELLDLMTERKTTSVTGKKAAEDVAVYFKLLQTTYGGYEYFGGDEVFLPIRDSLIEEVSSKVGILSRDLAKLLRNALGPVIADRHFRIERWALLDESHEQRMYYVPDLYFDDLSGLDMEYVRPTIGEDGALTHCFAALSGSKTELPEQAVLNGQTVRLAWKEADEFQVEKPAAAYQRKQVDGLTVLVCRTLSANGGAAAQLDQLAASGASYRDEPALAVDLRGNGGGNDTYGAMWIESYAGVWPQTKSLDGQKCSLAYLSCFKWSAAYEGVRQGPGYEEYMARMEDNLGHWQVEREDGLQINNKNTVLLVLIDRGTASSGEGFTQMLSSMEHVVLVGGNTSGCLQFGNVCLFYLPHSGLPVQMGSKQSFYGTMENTEGVGMSPDLWVNPPDALDAVVRLCDYYGLKQG